MIARFLLGLTLALLVGSWLESQETGSGDPPVRLKKKKVVPADANPPKEKAEPKKSDDPPMPQTKKDETKMPPEDGITEEMTEEEIYQRIEKNVKAAEENLANLDASEKTLQKQKDILEDIDRLLKKQQDQNSEDPENKDMNNSEGKKGEKNKQSGQKKNQKSQGKGDQAKKQGQGKQQGKGNNQAKGNQDGKGNNPPMGQGKQGENKDGKGNPMDGKGNEPGQGGNSPPGGLNPASDIFKEIWGHLPETLRAELNAYAGNRQFMDKYDEMIRKYYARVAEKGARKKK